VDLSKPRLVSHCILKASGLQAKPVVSSDSHTSQQQDDAKQATEHK
jgi:hypothetical protein